MKELQQELELVLEMLRELIFKVNDISHFSKEDREQVKYLKEVLGLLLKAEPLLDIPEEEQDPREDEEIIKRFLERQKK